MTEKRKLRRELGWWLSVPPYKKKYTKKMRKYGVTEAQYEQLLALQDNKCKICGKEETCLSNKGSIKKLAIDHDHKTNEIRGLLCHKCNVGLGYFNDDIGLLEKAIQYLKNSFNIFSNI